MPNQVPECTDAPAVPPAAEWFLPRDSLQALIECLQEDGYTVIGPVVDQEAITYQVISSVDDLPRGWTEEQSAGRYRLVRRDDEALFGYTVGPHSWKAFLFPPQVTVARADRSSDGRWEMTTPEETVPRHAFLGVRACELAAIAVQDRVFLEGPWVDPVYQARRREVFIVAVHCTQAASTCFCTSMGTGPECRTGFDLALTELEDGFVIQGGSDAGHEILERLDVAVAAPSQSAAAGSARRQAERQIRRHLDTNGLRDLLLNSLDDSQWDAVAGRCLSCTNCTMVCPTCFCSTVTDVPDLSGDHVKRERSWDSCFNVDFSRMSGGVIRNDVRSRYRQWLTHKLASWHDQFGQSGCVGCGRCITWCPPGIDLTEEVAAIRSHQEPIP